MLLFAWIFYKREYKNLFCCNFLWFRAKMAMTLRREPVLRKPANGRAALAKLTNSRAAPAIIVSREGWAKLAGQWTLYKKFCWPISNGKCSPDLWKLNNCKSHNIHMRSLQCALQTILWIIYNEDSTTHETFDCFPSLACLSPWLWLTDPLQLVNTPPRPTL